MFAHGSKEKHGFRWWWHLSAERQRCISVEFYWWSARFGVSVGTDDEGWNLSIRVPPFALYLSLEGLPLWQPTARIYEAPDGRKYPIPDRREFDFAIHDWTIRLTPWGRWGEWIARDPWWIRGLSIDLKNIALGRITYEAEELALVPC